MKIEGGHLGGVEHLVDLLAPRRLPESEPDYVVHDLQVTPASLTGILHHDDYLINLSSQHLLYFYYFTP